MCAAGLMPAAQAEDFFSALFGGFGHHHASPQNIFPLSSEDSPQPDMRPRVSYSSGQAYCVRACDGRYFPISGPGKESKASLCSNLCPQSETTLVFGAKIEDAETESGQRYSELPNAYRYRNEIIKGCTCNGKDQIGLAPVSIDKDPTLRKGDIVAGANGLVVANGSAGKRGAQLNFSPVPEAVRARYQRVPVVARE
jgi:hypothetical protein